MQLFPLPLFVVACGSVGGSTKGNDGSSSSGSGTSKSGSGTSQVGNGNQHIGNSGSYKFADSLLPLPGNYVSLSVGSFEVVNTWALLFFAIVWVAVAVGIVAIGVLVTHSGKPKRRRG